MNLTECRRRSQAPPVLDAPVQDIALLSQVTARLARGITSYRSRITFRPRWKVRPSWTLHLSPDWRSIVAIAQTAKEGDQDRAWLLLEEYLGYKPDTRLRVKMRREWAAASTWIVPKAVNRFARERARLAGEAMRDEESEAAHMRSRWYSYPELQEALDGYDDPLDEVHRAVYVTKKSLRPGEALTDGKVDHRVRYDNRSSRY